jgi:hypothetical protein
MYGGYEKPELFNVFLTMLSEGNVNSDVKDGKRKGFAGVVDFGVTPFGVFSDEDTPLTFNIDGNAIRGVNFKDGNNSKQGVGFGLEGEAGFWLVDNFVLSPVVAFDGKYDAYDDFYWKAGGGLTLRFSGMRWASDEWGDLYNPGYITTSRTFSENGFADHRYENNKILKYAYAQVYGAYSKESDFNLLFRVEEPDGGLGFHDKLGLMAEGRLYNLAGETPVAGGKPNEMSWEAQARVAWDINVKQHLVTPYVRGYINDKSLVKMRVGAYANFIPFTGFELAYTSANLNPNADTTAKPMSHYDGIKDAGRIELLIILKSDDIRPTVPKRMSDWNYPTVIQYY